MTTAILPNSLDDILGKAIGVDLPERPMAVASSEGWKDLTRAVGPFASPLSHGDGYQLRKILVIDDEAINVKLIQKCLHMAGYRAVETHTDPETAMDRIIMYQPDLVVCDVVMSVSGL